MLSSASFFPRASHVIVNGGMFSIIDNMVTKQTGDLNTFKYIRAGGVDGFIEYAQNRLKVAQALSKHCALYVSLNFMQS